VGGEESGRESRIGMKGACECASFTDERFGTSSEGMQEAGNIMARQANILLIDDDLSVRQALGEALTVENYQVALAANGPEADQHLRQRGERRIDAVLLDLSLGPECGWNVFDRLMSQHPQLPVIVMTASRGQPTASRVQNCVALMEKPLDLPLLFATLRQVTANGEPKAQLLGPKSSESKGCFGS
jgi:DNA-binding NtrC family response regulator